jgi:hypothetical protein
LGEAFEETHSSHTSERQIERSAAVESVGKSEETFSFDDIKTRELNGAIGGVITLKAMLERSRHAV